MPLERTSASAQRRHLSREHFAFLRGLVQGLPARDLWSRYMTVEGRFDERLVARTITWLKDELAATARRDRKTRIARLVSMDLSRTRAGEGGTGSPKRPTLEEFASRFEPGYYSERELIELFTEEFPPDRRAQRRHRLVAQQLDALVWLESVAANDPQLDDPVASWLPDVTASRLAAAGVHTLAQLIDRINGKGYRWWSGVAATGPTKAARIAAWLAPHAARLNRPIGGHVETPRRQLSVHVLAPREKQTGVVPMERLAVPASLDGRSGVFRAPRHLNLLRAETDLQAVQAWLRSKRSPHTVRAYTKEAERFVLWAVLVKAKPLSSMTVEDCEDYRDFMADPQPRDVWCGQRGRERWGPLWRPFNGPLDARSERHAVTILKNLYGWLNSQGYLIGNPWAGVTPRMPAAPRINAGRAFTKKQWALITERVRALPETDANRRLGVVLTLLYTTGLRREELVTRLVSDLVLETFDDHTGGWMLNVLGKGNRLRQVPIPDSVLAIVQDYLLRRGLPPDPAHPANRDAFLIGRVQKQSDTNRRNAPDVDPKAGISASTLYDQLKRFLDEAADALDASESRHADRLRMASVHWLRHTHGSHAIAAGVPIEVVKENLGHATIATTGIYVTAEKKRRHAEISKLLR
jgi:site-specific recombinase XerD